MVLLVRRQTRSEAAFAIRDARAVLEREV
jgi:hypothetical protein